MSFEPNMKRAKRDESSDVCEAESQLCTVTSETIVKFHRRGGAVDEISWLGAISHAPIPGMIPDIILVPVVKGHSPDEERVVFYAEDMVFTPKKPIEGQRLRFLRDCAVTKRQIVSPTGEVLWSGNEDEVQTDRELVKQIKAIAKPTLIIRCQVIYNKTKTFKIRHLERSVSMLGTFYSELTVPADMKYKSIRDIKDDINYSQHHVPTGVCSRQEYIEYLCPGAGRGIVGAEMISAMEKYLKDYPQLTFEELKAIAFPNTNGVPEDSADITRALQNIIGRPFLTSMSMLFIKKALTPKLLFFARLDPEEDAEWTELLCLLRAAAMSVTLILLVHDCKDRPEDRRINVNPKDLVHDVNDRIIRNYVVRNLKMTCAHQVDVYRALCQLFPKSVNY